jgi:hypothetical protein
MKLSMVAHSYCPILSQRKEKKKTNQNSKTLIKEIRDKSKKHPVFMD